MASPVPLRNLEVFIGPDKTRAWLYPIGSDVKWTQEMYLTSKMSERILLKYQNITSGSRVAREEKMDGRQFLRQVTAPICSAALAAAGPLRASTPATIGLGYGTHGFKSYPAAEAIRTIAGIGYDSAQLCLGPGSIDPVRCSVQARRELRSALDRYRLAVPCLFDRIDILGDATQHQAHLERIRADAQFGHDANAGVGGVSPCIGARLGGNTKDFEANKNLVADRLHDWEVGRQVQTVIAVKGHPPMIVDTSEKTEWVVKKVNSPWLRVEYDYGHFQTGGEELATILDRLRPYVAVISLQDKRLDSKTKEKTIIERKAGDVIFHMKGEDAPELTNLGTKTYRTLVIGVK